MTREQLRRIVEYAAKFRETTFPAGSGRDLLSEIDSLREKLKITEAALEEALTNVKTMGDTISYVQSQLVAAKVCFADDHAYAARAWVSKALAKIRGEG